MNVWYQKKKYVQTKIQQPVFFLPTRYELKKKNKKSYNIRYNIF